MDKERFTYVPNLSMGKEDCKNLLIKGDNKDVLPELVAKYGKQIRCIYIDPPYNNGDNYHYYNDNTSQSSWLKDMRNVLRLLKPLLSKDGSIWISIDDKEMAYLKIEADKVFGRENFAATIIWQQRKTRENRAVFSCNHEYILVYAKDINAFKKSRNLLPVDEDFIKAKYKNPDNDPRGPWQSITANVQAGHAVPSQFYTIVAPNGTRHNPPKGRCWAYNEERMKREIAENNIWFGIDGNNTPRIKKFLSSAKVGLTPETLWTGDEIGTTDSAKKHLLSLFSNGDKVFDTPKPEELIKQILEIATNEGDYVLDCYLGSGTTVAAAHKLNRNYIGIEIGDQMTDLVVSRLNQVINGEEGGISKAINWQGGGDFAFYTFNKQEEAKVVPHIEIQAVPTIQTPVHYKQLDLFEVMQQYPEYIVSNSLSSESIPQHELSTIDGMPVDLSKNCLLSLVKPDNMERYLDQSAKIYYTGKRFPDTVALNKLFYFMPYLKGKGVQDLYLIRIARVGSRKEGQPDNDPNDIRLVFEIEFLGQMFDEYKPLELNIWHTFTDTTMKEMMKLKTTGDSPLLYRHAM